MDVVPGVPPERHSSIPWFPSSANSSTFDATVVKFEGFEAVVPWFTSRTRCAPLAAITMPGWATRAKARPVATASQPAEPPRRSMSVGSKHA